MAKSATGSTRSSLSRLKMMKRKKNDAGVLGTDLFLFLKVNGHKKIYTII